MNDTALVVPSEVQENLSALNAYIGQVTALAIADNDQYAVAGNILTEIKGRYNGIEASRKALKEPVLEQARRIDAFFKAPLDALDRARDIVDRKRKDYRADIEARRIEAEIKAAEVARKERVRLEQEAAKIEETARKKRQEEEAKARAFEEAGQKERAEAARKAALEKEAARQAEADQRRAMAEMVQAPIVSAPLPTLKGLSVRKSWRAQVNDKMMLIKAIAGGQAPQAAVDVNQPFLNKQASALKTEFNYPGVEAIEVEARE